MLKHGFFALASFFWLFQNVYGEGPVRSPIQANDTDKAVEIVVTPYKTTILADGKDTSLIIISVTDEKGNLVTTSDALITFQLTGNGSIKVLTNQDPQQRKPVKTEKGEWQQRVYKGKLSVVIQSGSAPGMIHFKASSPGLWDGGTDIITIRPGQKSTLNDPYTYQNMDIRSTAVLKGNILGADISFLPELEARGIKFYDKGRQQDALEILKNHGFNYIRLRLFVEPANDSGYSPGKGFCDLPHTLAMAHRIKDAGMDFLLDFHYSDTWADPGKQYKPAAWRGLNFTQLAQKMYDYTFDVMQQLKAQGTPPQMVQVGNEINHGIIWPEGNVQHLDSLAVLLNAGNAAVKKTDPSIITMLHIALGGQNVESEFFIDNMIQRDVSFDIIGQSYYPKWHGTLPDLEMNLNRLLTKYNRPVVVAEYSHVKIPVNKIAFSLPGAQMKGTFIWEPLNTWEAIFDKEGKSNSFMSEYDEINKTFIFKK